MYLFNDLQVADVVLLSVDQLVDNLLPFLLAGVGAFDNRVRNRLGPVLLEGVLDELRNGWGERSVALCAAKQRGALLVFWQQREGTLHDSL